MESAHVISITKEENIAEMKESKTLPFPLGPISSYPSLDKQKRIEHDTRNMIHSIKVGISLVFVSLLFLLNPIPLFEQVGENAMWAIMTVIVIFEFSAGN